MLARSLTTAFVTLAALAGTPLAASPGAAAPPACGGWTAGMQEDEGGPVLTATVCAGGAEPSPTLSLQCAGSAYLRYDLGTYAGPEPALDSSARFDFTVGTTKLAQKLDYQAMDGSFAADLAPSAPLLALLRRGATLEVTDSAGKYPTRRFSLMGSGAAIGEVLAHCGDKPAGGD